MKQTRLLAQLNRVAVHQKARFLSLSSIQSITTSAHLRMKFNLWEKIKENEPEMQPPVNNRMIAEDFIKVMIVGGPNERNDYHVSMGSELFYQLKGSMDVKIMNPKTKLPEKVTIKEGEVFLLPCGVPHSPQRYANTMGLVLEREKSVNEIDCLRWYSTPTETDMNQKPKVIYEEYFHCSDLGTQLVPVIRRYREFAKTLANTSYYSNQDELVGKSKEGMIQLNNYFYSKNIENSNFQVLNIKEFIMKETTKLLENFSRSGMIPHQYASFFPVFQNEFEFRVYTNHHQRLLLSYLKNHPGTSSASSTTGESRNELPIVLPFLNSAKEYFLYQFSGNATLRKKRLVWGQASTKKQEITSETIELKEGEVVIIQDRENNLQGLTIDFQDCDDGACWFIANNASVD
jgi:3-hydroxyanthranilate 3,4-dioxygenase